MIEESSVSSSSSWPFLLLPVLSHVLLYVIRRWRQEHVVVESRMEDGSGEGWRKGEGAFSFTELVKYLSYDIY